MAENNKMDSPRIVVYQAAHPVEARRARSWLLARGIAGIEIEDRVYRPRPSADRKDQELYQNSSWCVVAPPDRAPQARAVLEEARAAGRSFAPDASDLHGIS